MQIETEYDFLERLCDEFTLHYQCITNDNVKDQIHRIILDNYFLGELSRACQERLILLKRNASEINKQDATHNFSQGKPLC